MSYPKKGGLSAEQLAAIARIPNELHCACESITETQLTTTPQLVTTWVTSTISPPVGVTYNDAGTFTTTVSAGTLVILERTYRNGDNNPDDEVDVTITVNSGGVVIFTSTLPIPPAVLRRGDGVLSVTDPFLIPASIGDEFEIYVSASEAGANPTDTNLVRARLTSTANYAL